MRSLVCAQCHVEYYFKGEGKYLTFPWDKGLSADSMEAYYDQVAFTDFPHGMSKASMLKAQHPDYEVYMTGIHADRGVACADCHMPYKREGSIKFTDHKIQSPLNNIAGSCQVCHRESEEKLRANVYERQDKVNEIKLMAEKNLVYCHAGAKLAWAKGATEEEMKPVLALIRSAQWRWDWVAAANGMGFHSPIESLRVLATSIQRSQEAHALLTVILLKHDVKLPFELPDISTKEKAHQAIGLEIEKIREEKADFLKNVVPQWDVKK
jgi:nitrite reductase (cytochrome c-552)